MHTHNAMYSHNHQNIWRFRLQFNAEVNEIIPMFLPYGVYNCFHFRSLIKQMKFWVLFSEYQDLYRISAGKMSAVPVMFARNQDLSIKKNICGIFGTEFFIKNFLWKQAQFGAVRWKRSVFWDEIRKTRNILSKY